MKGRGRARYAVARAIEINSDDLLQAEQGSLYPAHQAAMDYGRGGHFGEQPQGQVLPADGEGPATRGRRQLAAETSRWERFVRAISSVLRPTESEEKP